MTQNATAKTTGALSYAGLQRSILAAISPTNGAAIGLTGPVTLTVDTFDTTNAGVTPAGANITFQVM